MIRPATLWIALAISLPAFYQVLVTQQLEIEDAIIRFLIAVPVAMLMLWILRFITAGYGRRKDREHPLRRRDDESDGSPPATTADAP
ncbi:hypothetical protein GCM10010124_08210 [Pilimelia terevasa]|uniref:Uncharacterized protein n=1 Tax=Pilimelia terevasa TaxID=53372 RepID=A0A8J3BKS8_9ACTN|nr:hypothetical protein [Pilimelia terevasa]GGK18014.1 hypothetical protein GCM10010124_08210 [Pilimelia terevasa]